MGALCAILPWNVLLPIDVMKSCLVDHVDFVMVIFDVLWSDSDKPE